jgi:hypothetical protein
LLNHLTVPLYCANVVLLTHVRWPAQSRNMSNTTQKPRRMFSGLFGYFCGRPNPGGQYVPGAT